MNKWEVKLRSNENAMIIAYGHIDTVRQANLFRCSLINFDGFSGELWMNRQNATLDKWNV